MKYTLCPTTYIILCRPTLSLFRPTLIRKRPAPILPLKHLNILEKPTVCNCNTVGRARRAKKYPLQPPQDHSTFPPTHIFRPKIIILPIKLPVSLRLLNLRDVLPKVSQSIILLLTTGITARIRSNARLNLSFYLRNPPRLSMKDWTNLE